MKQTLLTILMSLMVMGGVPARAAEPDLDKYLASFDYAARKEMKIDSKGLIELLKEGKAQLIDIRFKEENATWKVHSSLSIALNELPQRLAELDTSKIIVTACPHKDRATIAMLYLRSKGIPAKYLTDGLIGLAENLRGDAARDFIQQLPK
jgi:rhodanese-related sulfurtransferase